MNDVICPYCGERPWAGGPPGLDRSVKVRCRKCGGVFEYMPGFGTFALPDMGRHETPDVVPSGVTFGPSYTDGTSPQPVGMVEEEEAETQEAQGCCGKCVICCVCWVLITLLVGLLTVAIRGLQ